MGRGKRGVSGLMWKSEGKRPFGIVGVYVRVILKLILNRMGSGPD
jgi:hypothetical protein